MLNSLLGFIDEIERQRNSLQRYMQTTHGDDLWSFLPSALQPANKWANMRSLSKLRDEHFTYLNSILRPFDGPLGHNNPTHNPIDALLRNSIDSITTQLQEDDSTILLKYLSHLSGRSEETRFVGLAMLIRAGEKVLTANIVREVLSTIPSRQSPLEIPLGTIAALYITAAYISLFASAEHAAQIEIEMISIINHSTIFHNVDAAYALVDAMLWIATPNSHAYLRSYPLILPRNTAYIAAGLAECFQGGPQETVSVRTFRLSDNYSFEFAPLGDCFLTRVLDSDGTAENWYLSDKQWVITELTRMVGSIETIQRFDRALSYKNYKETGTTVKMYNVLYREAGVDSYSLKVSSPINESRVLILGRISGAHFQWANVFDTFESIEKLRKENKLDWPDGWLL